MTESVLPRIDSKKIAEIKDVVNKMYLEELRGTVGAENYQLLLDLPLSLDEQRVMFSLMDMLLHTDYDDSVKFNDYGLRVAENRELGETINSHLSTYIYNLMEQVTTDYPFAKAVIEVVMFDLLSQVVSRGPGVDVESVYENHYLSVELEKDLNYYAQLTHSERVWIRNVFMDMNNYADPLTQYRVQLSLRKSGKTFKDIANNNV